jgi:hypothetical protein
VLADLNDINTFLPQDKLSATDGNEEIGRHQVDVERVIKGYLSSTYTAATLAAWADPDSTPPFIRSIAGRLIAAFHYARKLSEDMPDWDRTYPQRLYDEAMAMLLAVQNGDVDLGIPGEEAGTQFSSNFFYPTKDTEPVFTMDMRF